MVITDNNKTYKDDNDIDWASARWDYENSKCSFGKLAKKYGTYPMSIHRVAKEGGWKKFKAASREISEAVIKFEEKQSATVKATSILETVGIRKVQEIVRELGVNYSTVDEPMVIAYAESYQRYLKIAGQVNKEGEVIISPKTGGEYLNPKFNAMQSLKNDLIKFGNQLGLSIAARKKLSLDFGDNEDKKTLFDMVSQLSHTSELDV